MLPMLLDAAGFQQAANITRDEFMYAMMQSLIPPAVGMFNGAALWNADAANKTADQLQVLKANGMFASVAAVVAPVTVPIVAAPVPSSNGITYSLCTTEPAPNPDEFPAEMNQTLALRFLGVSSGWLDKRVKEKLISWRKDSQNQLYTLYKKDDLLALMDLPIYKFRKRNGYIGGVLKSHVKQKPGTNTAYPPMEKRTDDLLGDHAAHDYLGITQGILALTRKDGSGPAWLNVDGVPKYRICDLDTFKAQMDKDKLPRVVAQVIRRPETVTQESARTIDVNDAATFLGVTRKTMQNFRTHGTGPAHEKRDGRLYYSITDLRAYQDSAPRALQSARHMLAYAKTHPAEMAKRTVTMRKGLAKSKTSGARPAKKSATLGGQAIRH